ncbi:hypothetical protein HYD50_02435 [Mycoplasmopsis bovis]|nr:hypothetical protein [Mycoplasmopsis bovis]QQH72564.1 hypothetical protein HYD50_02435 [Mycoplasmopsis bovis]
MIFGVDNTMEYSFRKSKRMKTNYNLKNRKTMQYMKLIQINDTKAYFENDLGLLKIINSQL